MKYLLIIITAASLLLFCIISCGEKKLDVTGTNIDANSVYMLMDLMETLIEKNPDYKAQIAKMDSSSSQDRTVMTDDIMLKNNEDPEILEKLNALLESPTYKLYYSQFRNVKPANHKMALLALPYAWVPSPGGVSRTLYEVCLNIDKLRPWVDEIIPRIDLTRSHNLALEWLPKKDYEIPPVHFIIDGNGDAFARSGKVCFDLYGVLLRELPQETRYEMLNSISATDAENVLGHELFHIYALPYLNAHDAPINKDWKTTTKDQLTKRIVTEGIAMQCNPLTGFKKEIFEDSAVVKYWIKQFNGIINSFNNDQITEDEFRKWFGETYFVVPRNLLTDYFSKDYQDKELEQKVIENLIDRPSMVYTLGWWMVTNTLKSENGKEKVLGIVSDYKKIFDEYNNSLPEKSDDLKIVF